MRGGLNSPLKHEKIVAETSSEYKYVKKLMSAEIPEPVMKNRKLECIDYAPNRVKYSSCQQPEKSHGSDRGDNLGKSKNTAPAKGYIYYGRNPLGTGDPEGFHQDSNGG